MKIKELTPFIGLGIVLVSGLVWINVKLATMEITQATTAKEVDTISNNHLSHLQSSYEKLANSLSKLEGKVDEIIRELKN